MAEQLVEPIENNHTKSRFQRLMHHLRNPVTVKELRSRMRGRRAFVVLTIYLAVMSGIITLIYLAFINSSARPGSDVQIAGKVLFSTVVGIQGFLVLFVAPSFTAGAITGEKERQTFDLLRTTLLSSRAFVTGKLLSALSYVLLLILAAVPLQSFAFLLGGVTFIELFLSQIILMVTAVTIAMFGLYCSARMKSTLGASVLTFAGVLILTFGLPALAGLTAAILGPILFTGGTNTDVLEIIATYSGLTLSAFNLPATMIISDLALVEEGALFYFTQTIGGRIIYIFSPWPLFILFHSLMAWFFYRLTAKRVQKIATE